MYSHPKHISDRLAASDKPIRWKVSERTSSYVFTVDLSNPHHKLQVDKLKAEVKEWNKNRPKGAHAKRVQLQHRLGKDNPFSTLYTRGGKHWSYVSRVLIRHAGYSDVYIQERYTWN